MNQPKVKGEPLRILLIEDNPGHADLVNPVDFEKFSRMMSDVGFYWLSWNRNPWT